MISLLLLLCHTRRSWTDVVLVSKLQKQVVGLMYPSTVTVSSWDIRRFSYVEEKNSDVSFAISIVSPNLTDERRFVAMILATYGMVRLSTTWK